MHMSQLVLQGRRVSDPGILAESGSRSELELNSFFKVCRYKSFSIKDIKTLKEMHISQLVLQGHRVSGPGILAGSGSGFEFQNLSPVCSIMFLVQ